MGKAILPKLNVKKNKLLKVGKIQSDVGVTVEHERIEVVEHFKYIGSLKSADGNCNNGTRSRIGMTKKRMLDLIRIWRDRSIHKHRAENDTSVVGICALVCVYGSHLYGAEGWTLAKAGEKRIDQIDQQNYGCTVGCSGSLME